MYKIYGTDANGNTVCTNQRITHEYLNICVELMRLGGYEVKVESVKMKPIIRRYLELYTK